MVSPYPTRGVILASGLPALYADRDVFPALPGADFIQSKAPNFSTALKQAANGAEVRASWWAGPIYSFKVQFNVLRDRPVSSLLPLGSELQQLMAFFNGRRGRYGFFFYYDPTDNAVSNQAIATGDGSSTTFQLVRAVGAGTPYAAIEPVYALWNLPAITVGGTVASGFNISPWGVLTFNSPPANGAQIAWSGNFLFVCRFDQDKLEFQQLVKDLWSQGGLQFTGILPG